MQVQGSGTLPTGRQLDQQRNHHGRQRLDPHPGGYWSAGVDDPARRRCLGQQRHHHDQPGHRRAGRLAHRHRHQPRFAQPGHRRRRPDWHSGQCRAYPGTGTGRHQQHRKLGVCRRSHRRRHRHHGRGRPRQLVSAPDVLDLFNYAFNLLDGVTLDGTLDMSSGNNTVTVVDGLTLNTDLDLSAYNANLEFKGSNPQAVGIGSAVSSATIHLSGLDSFLANVGTQTLTIDPGITIAGGSPYGGFIFGFEPGTIGEINNRGTIEQNTPGDLQLGGLVNDGTITASHGGVISLETALLGLGSPWINADDGTITARDGGSLALYDNWINDGRILVDASSSVSLGSPVTEGNYSPTPGLIWSNSGTLAIAKGATVNLGDYFTTDEFADHFRQLGVNLDLSQYTVNLVGTIDNSPADNPLTGGNLVLDGATGSLYLSAGVIDGGTITTTGRQELIATDDSYNYDDSGPYTIGGGTLNGVTLDGTLDMQSIPAATATILNGLTLNGTIALTGSGAVLDLGDDDSTPETIGGTGTILFGQTSGHPAKYELWHHDLRAGHHDPGRTEQLH